MWAAALGASSCRGPEGETGDDCTPHLLHNVSVIRWATSGNGEEAWLQHGAWWMGVLHQDQTTLVTEVTARGPIFSSRLYLCFPPGAPTLRG